MTEQERQCWKAALRALRRFEGRVESTKSHGDFRRNKHEYFKQVEETKRKLIRSAAASHPWSNEFDRDLDAVPRDFMRRLRSTVRSIMEILWASYPDNKDVAIEILRPFERMLSNKYATLDVTDR